MAQVEVYGVRETIAQLKALDTSLRKQAINDIKAAAEPLRADIAGRIPTTAPLSGWDHKGRTGWTKKNTKVTTNYGGRKGRGRRETWPLVRVTLKGSAASIYDMAGRGSDGNTAQGRALIDNLGGNPSRAAWPAAEQKLPQVQSAVLEAIRKVSAQVNRNLVTRGTR